MKGPVLLLSLSMLTLACRSRNDKSVAPPVPAGMPHGANPHAGGMGGAMGMKKESVVVVPDFQKGKFKAVRLSIQERASGKERVVEAPLETDFSIPGTSLIIHVDHILTAFGMGDGVITSRSEQMTNPAAQVRIWEKGGDVWKGWLFSLFPDAHPFGHDKYAVKLVDFVPAK